MAEGFEVEDQKISENRIYPRIMFAAPESGSGKTLITCGFLEILKKRGLSAVSFKCGPDYIDPLFHMSVTGIKATNLDSFFLSREEIEDLFLRRMDEHPSSLAVMEGVMGYYDGLAGTSFTASSFDIADCLNCPVVIILDMKNEGPSPEKVIKELIDRVPQSHIKGVILNRATREDAFGLRLKIETLGVKLFGYVPEDDDAKVESRHLGLKIPSDDEKFLRKISAFSDIIEETTDIDGMIKLAEDAGGLKRLSYEEKNRKETRPYDIGLHINTTAGHKSFRGTIAVAHDDAFCFQYEDNLDFLKELGYELTVFSPLNDKALPEGISAILLCGGYPEVYAGRLSANEAMMDSVGQAFGIVKIMAECGGFMYLHESLEGSDGAVYKMAGCIKAKAYRTGRSSRFGYISLFSEKESEKQITAGCGKAPLIKAHEFHYWDSTAPGSDLLAVKPVSGRSWECCYSEPALLAGFPHLYYRSGPAFIYSFLAGEDAICLRL